MEPFFRVPAPLPAEVARALPTLRLLPGLPESVGETLLLAGTEAMARLAHLRETHPGPIVVLAPLATWPQWTALGVTRLVATETPAEVLEPILRQIVADFCRQNEQRLLINTLLARSGVGITVVDDEGHVRAYNDRARAVLGIEPGQPDDSVGRPAADYHVLRGDAHPIHHAATQGVEVPETVFELIQGGAVRINAVPLMCGPHRLGAVAFVRPTNATADQTLATGVHALKNPLSVVQGFAQLLQEELGGAVSPDALHLLKRIEVNTARLWWRVDDLHRFIRLAEVRFEREVCPLDDVLAAAHRAVQRRGRPGAVEVAEGLPTVVGDFSRLVELFETLIDNGLLYQAPGSAPRVDVTGERIGSLCRITLEDNGLGIAPEDRGRIFEPFQRLHRHDEIEGTGLGLPIALRIVERHGGHIEVHTAPGGGSRFLVTLPYEA